jgi:hypothetical protein
MSDTCTTPPPTPTMTVYERAAACRRDFEEGYEYLRTWGSYAKLREAWRRWL